MFDIILVDFLLSMSSFSIFFSKDIGMHLAHGRSGQRSEDTGRKPLRAETSHEDSSILLNKQRQQSWSQNSTTLRIIVWTPGWGSPDNLGKEIMKVLKADICIDILLRVHTRGYFFFSFLFLLLLLLLAPGLGVTSHWLHWYSTFGSIFSLERL